MRILRISTATLGVLVAMSLSLGCDQPDIRDKGPINPANPDARVATIDADITIPDADTTDADLTLPDADLTIPDADLSVPDADPNAAIVFCNRYQNLCGYDAMNNNRFDDETTCLNTYNTLDAVRMVCVEDQLDQLEIDMNPNSHCSKAMGNGPCA
jgi:hypothetical protein